MPQARILVVDDEPDIRSLVREILEDEGYEVLDAQSAESAREARRNGPLDLALLDIWMEDVDGITLLREWSSGGELPFPVIMMSGHASIDTAVEATKLGAYDFIEKPIALNKLLLTVARAIEAGQLRRENRGLREQLPSIIEPVGVSRAMKDLREQLRRLSTNDAWVLISGEPGVGKATVARYLHSISHRSEAPLVEFNAGAIPDQNLSTELFGSEEREQVHFGRLEQANDGSILLDDVGELPDDVQSRLASALEGRSLMRIGGHDPVELNARILATSRDDLEQAINDGRFRRELYYQLNVVPLHIPPLRERREDIPELLNFYADHFSADEQLPYRHFSVAAQNRLRNHTWPGNVRELKNLVQRLLILGTHDEIGLDEVDGALGNLQPAQQGAPVVGGIDINLPLREAREQFERSYLILQLREAGGSVGKLAEISGMERTHLYRKLRSLDIDPKKAG